MSDVVGSLDVKKRAGVRLALILEVFFVPDRAFVEK